MKIEIGESLIYSFLKHEKKCLISQMNWKPSGNWQVDSECHELVKYEFEKINKHHAFSEIFKSNFEQTLKQAEIEYEIYVKIVIMLLLQFFQKSIPSPSFEFIVLFSISPIFKKLTKRKEISRRLIQMEAYHQQNSPILFLSTSIKILIPL